MFSGLVTRYTTKPRPRVTLRAHDRRIRQRYFSGKGKKGTQHSPGYANPGYAKHLVQTERKLIKQPCYSDPGNGTRSSPGHAIERTIGASGSDIFQVKEKGTRHSPGYANPGYANHVEQTERKHIRQPCYSGTGKDTRSSPGHAIERTMDASGSDIIQVQEQGTQHSPGYAKHFEQTESTSGNHVIQVQEMIHATVQATQTD